MDSIDQTAPFPDALAELVEQLTYKDGWRFALEDIDRGQGSKGLTLSVYVTGPNSYEPHDTRTVVHYMIVPPAAYDARSWLRWILDQIIAIETHEVCEWMEISGTKPYAPHHGPGRNPYTIHELGTDDEIRTSFRGDVKPA